VNNTGTITNAAWSTAGKFGSALRFNGSSNSYVTVNDNSTLDLTDGMTLEAWVNPSKLTSIDNNWISVISKENRSNRGNDVVYGLYAGAGTNNPPRVDILVNGTVYTASASSVLSRNTWTFLAATYNGSTLSMYVNGTLVGSRSVSGSIANSPDPLRIGGDWSGEMFTGLIDNVRIYNTALGQSQIQSDMGSRVASSSTSTGAQVSTASVASTVTGLQANTSSLVGKSAPASGTAANESGRAMPTLGSSQTVTIPRRQSAGSVVDGAVPSPGKRLTRSLLVKHLDRTHMTEAGSNLS
jgi:hypothetical protein